MPALKRSKARSWQCRAFLHSLSARIGAASPAPGRVLSRSRLPGAALAVLLLAGLTAGCATGLSQKECQQADWRTIGYEDGLRGMAAERIGNHRTACAEHGVVPDLANYTEGRERGLAQYCVPRIGYRDGEKGRTYANVCPADSEPGFLEGYRVGRQIYDARAASRKLQTQAQDARAKLARLEATIKDTLRELEQDDLPADRRRQLARDLVRLGADRPAIELQISQLASSADQAAAQLDALERLNPYRP